MNIFKLFKGAEFDYDRRKEENVFNFSIFLFMTTLNRKRSFVIRLNIDTHIERNKLYHPEKLSEDNRTGAKHAKHGIQTITQNLQNRSHHKRKRTGRRLKQ